MTDSAVFPSGQVLRISSTVAAVSDRWRSLSSVRSSSTSVRVESGRVGDAAQFSEKADEYPGKVTESATLKTGRVEVVEHRDQGTSYFRWAGEYSEMMVWMPGYGYKLDAFASALDEFEIVDSPNGVILNGRAGLGHTVEHSVSANQVEGFGFLVYYPSDRPIPKNAVRARSGVLWRQREEDHEDVVLATERGSFEISVNGATESHRELAATILEDLSVVAV